MSISTEVKHSCLHCLDSVRNLQTSQHVLRKREQEIQSSNPYDSPECPPLVRIPLIPIKGSKSSYTLTLNVLLQPEHARS
jgi:hypothetical protein